MMTAFAVVSDIHGNLPALEAVVADIRARGISTVFDLGDCLSGPLWPRQTAERLMALSWPAVRGNHERQLLGRDSAAMAASDRFAAATLDAAHWSWIGDKPECLTPFSDVLMVHGTPGSDTEYLTETVNAQGCRPATVDEIETRLDVSAQTLVFCGHTHVPHVVPLSQGRLVVNPGSVGLPAYTDDIPYPHVVEAGSPLARYAVVAGAVGAWQAEIVEVPYDWEAAARQAAENGRPDWLDPLRYGRVRI